MNKILLWKVTDIFYIDSGGIRIFLNQEDPSWYRFGENCWDNFAYWSYQPHHGPLRFVINQTQFDGGLLKSFGFYIDFLDDYNEYYE